VEPSVGGVGTVMTVLSPRRSNGLYKAEIIHRRRPWRHEKSSSSRRWHGGVTQSKWPPTNPGRFTVNKIEEGDHRP
jgi:hypothetical protein